MILKVKKFSDTAMLPTSATFGSAGNDLYADLSEPITIYPHQTVMIKSGIGMEIPFGYVGLIYPRSGISTNQGLRIANCVGVIDSDYRGEIGLPMHNDSDSVQIVHPHERVAQIVIQRYERAEIAEVKELSKTERGGNGFGSSGK